MPAPHSDRNLLFGILALQMDFVSRDALLKAMNAWVIHKDRALGDILRDNNALGGEEQALLEALVTRHLQRHDNDFQRSLAALSSVESARAALTPVEDAEIQASLSVTPPTLSSVALLSTRDSSSPEATGSGPRFRVLRPHARGGLGEVFVARDAELNREVALKEIQNRHADDPLSRSRFLSEAEITGGLEHPGIVPVYGLGQYADGRPFYAMRFIRGDSLHDAIQRYHAPAAQPGQEPATAPLHLRQLLGRFLDVCNAIEYAHSRGVLHRDLKPGNILLGPYGETLVVDWGLAKPLGRAVVEGLSSEAPLQPMFSQGAAATQMGQVIGTPEFMSPEQAAGRLDLLGAATDVYSLGATLYSLLTGQSPFPVSRDLRLDEQLARVQQGDFLPPRRVRADVPPPLEAICLKAMARQPGDRYPSPRALAQEIERWLADEPVAAYREPLLARLGRWTRKRTALVGSVTTALLAMLASAGVALALLTQAWDETQERADSETAEKDRARQLADDNAALALKEGEARQAAELARRAAEDEQRRTARGYYATRAGLASQAWLSSDPARMRTLLEDLRPETGKEDLRDFEWHYLNRLARLTEPLTLPARKIAFSEDSQYLIVFPDRGTEPIRLYDPLTKRVVRAVPPPEGLEWSINDTFPRLTLAQSHYSARERVAALVDPVTGKIEGRYPLQGPFHPTLTLGRRFRYSQTSEGKPGERIRTLKLQVVSTITGKEALNLSIPGVQSTHVTVSEDDRWMMAYLTRGTVQEPLYEARVWDLTTGKGVQLGESSKTYASPTLSARGGRAWIVEPVTAPPARWQVRLWDLASGQTLNTVALPGAAAAMRPAGEYIFNSDASGLVLWSNESVELFNLLTGKLTLKVPFARPLSVNVFPARPNGLSPDGELVALLLPDQSLNVYEVKTGQLRRPAGRAGQDAWAMFGPDSVRLFVAESEASGLLQVWDVRMSHTRPRVLRGAGGSVQIRAVSPDGKRIAVVNSMENVSRFWLWDLSTEMDRQTIDLKFNPMHEPRRNVRALTFLAASSRVAWADRYGVVQHSGGAEGRYPIAVPGETSPVAAISFSADGRLLASATLEGRIRLFETVGGKELPGWQGEKAAIADLAFDSGGNRLVAVMADGTIVAGPVAQPRSWKVKRVPGASWRQVRFSPDGERIAAAGASLYLFSADALEQQQVIATARGPFVFHPAGNLLAAPSKAAPGEVLLLDAATGQMKQRLRGHTGSLVELAFDAAGLRLISGSADGTARVWDVKEGKEISVYRGHSQPLWSVALSPDGKKAASSSADGKFSLWDSVTAMPLFPPTMAGGVDRLLFSADGSRLATALSNKTVLVWNTSNLTQVDFMVLAGHYLDLDCVDVSPDGKLIAGGNAEGSPHVWEAETGRERFKLSDFVGQNRQEPLCAVAFRPDNHMLAATSSDGLRLWDLEAGRLVHRFPFRVQSRSGAAVAFSADGKHVAATIEEPGTQLKIWNVSSKKEVLTIRDHTGPVRAVAFSVDGTQFATGGADRTIKVRDLATGRVIRLLTGHDAEVSCMTFTRDGTFLISAGKDRLGMVWDLARGQRHRTLAGHTHPVLALTLGPGDRRLATVDNAGIVRVWDTFTWQEVLSMTAEGTGYESPERQIRFAGDGRRLLSANREPRLLVFDASPPSAP